MNSFINLICYLLTGLLALSYTSCRFNSHESISPYSIEIRGIDYEWHYTYPGPDGILYTKDDLSNTRNLVLPYKQEVELILKSNDYLYFFELPEFDQIGPAISEKTHLLNFVPDKTGTYELKGSQMCAYTHDKLMGKVSVYRPFWYSYAINKLAPN